jgi:phosphoglycolate phosphatase-like HAD superfamily hydrolase
MGYPPASLLSNEQPAANRPRSPLVLDFEGVLCNSSREWMQVAWHGTQGHPVEAVGTQGEERAPADVVWRFEWCSPFIRHPGHWLVPLLEEVPPCATQDAFEAAYQALDRHRRETFLEVVSQYRERLRSERTAAWARLHRWYPRILPWLRTHGDVVFLVTARDQASVLTLLERRGVTLPPDHILGEQSSKQAALGAIARLAQVPPQDLIFVDDHPANVQEARQAGYRAFLALWGHWGRAVAHLHIPPQPSLRLTDLVAGRFPARET